MKEVKHKAEALMLGDLVRSCRSGNLAVVIEVHDNGDVDVVWLRDGGRGNNYSPCHFARVRGEVTLSN